MFNAILAWRKKIRETSVKVEKTIFTNYLSFIPGLNKPGNSETDRTWNPALVSRALGPGGRKKIRSPLPRPLTSVVKRGRTRDHKMGESMEDTVS